MEAATETCENCGRVIGKLETLRIWQDQVVCRACEAELHRQYPATAPRQQSPAFPPAFAGCVALGVIVGVIGVGHELATQSASRGESGSVPGRWMIAAGVVCLLIGGLGWIIWTATGKKS